MYIVFIFHKVDLWVIFKIIVANFQKIQSVFFNGQKHRNLELGTFYVKVPLYHVESPGGKLKKGVYILFASNFGCYMYDLNI